MNDYQDRGSVHQVVYRWDGNHGRQGTGMNAVAHSCDAGRAEELGRELGPLLWVSGGQAARSSVVRTLSRDGDVLLVQRWPTTDRGGRPSTVSHVLVGGPGTLKVRQCLGLARGGWGSREKAESATGKQDVIECAQLDELALRRLPGMLEELPSVNHALTLTAAEWLRDPTQRISLLMEERGHPGWPDRSAVPLVYLGLFLLFGPWLDRHWTFATYDTADSHPLRLTSVPRWEEDTGGSGPLARVRGGKPAGRRFELWAAAELVRHLLAHPEADAGVPQLIDELPGGASLDWEHRRARLKEILGADRTPPAGIRIPMPVPTPAPVPIPAPAPAPVPTWDREPEAAYPEVYEDPPRQAFPDPRLHQDLRGHRRTDVRGRSMLLAELRGLPDELLLHELRSGELPADSTELLLDVLGEPQRVQVRPPELRHELCAEVLHKDLYFAPHEPPGEGRSGADRASRAAHLFSWAVAPLARDKRHLRPLQELLYRLSRDAHPTTGNWLRQSIVEPPHGRIPDLPPEVWAQLLANTLVRVNRPPQPAPPAPQLPPVPRTTVPTPLEPPPQPPAHPPGSFMDGVYSRMGSAGCLLGGGVTFCVISTIIVVVWFFS
ncbi:hypothetical protein [Streptomyces sp. NPDC093568]|uniref:hypothetical protein n=1 Tax=Streptomyces sp. NPDC093568 TaxID=3366041 RepID=UPI0037F83BC3